MLSLKMDLRVWNMLLPHPVFGCGSVIFALLACLLLTLLFRMNSKKRQWPPSPPTRPLLGNLHQINKDGNLVSVVTEMAKTCGPVMTLWMGTSPLIVISGYEAIWEALVHQASNFASRPQMYSRRFTSADYRTFLGSPCDEHWTGLRKILKQRVLSPLHVASHGSSHSRYANHLIENLVEQMKANNGVVRPCEPFKLISVSFIAELCFGSDLPYDREYFNTKIEELIGVDILLSRKGSSLLDGFPVTRYFVPSSWNTVRKWKALRSRVLELLVPIIRSGRSYRESLNRTAPSSFLNCLLSAAEGNKLSEEEIAFFLYELFLLGVDSTALTLEWAVAYLITHPHIQDRAYQEINEAILPRGRTVCIEDMGKLPYIDAVVKETLRKDAIAPLAMPHQTVEDCKVMGVHIPAKSVVVFNTYGTANDPQVWRKPEVFTPERFLGHENELQKDNKVRMSYLPFGAGRRVCAGMDVVSVHVPVTLANLVSKFEWMPVREGCLPDLTPDVPWILRFMKTPLQSRIRCR